jgi:flagellar biosynthetic protein FliR
MPADALLGPVGLVAGEVFAVLLVFARLGAALMLVPGFGEHHVLPRLRLLLAFCLSLLLAPTLAIALPAPPAEPLALAGLVVPEVVVGLLLGFAARLCLAAVHAGGSLIALQSGLSAAAMFDPSEAAQSTIPAAFLGTAALTLLFAADFHHLLLRAVAASCATFPLADPLGGGLDREQAAALLVRLSAETIATGLRIAGPMIVAGLLVNLALGALGRMVPAFPVLFLALPIQLLLALVVLELSLPAALTLFGHAFGGGIAWLDGAG